MLNVDRKIGIIFEKELLSYKIQTCRTVKSIDGIHDENFINVFRNHYQ